MKLMRETRQVFGGMDIWRQYEWALGLLSLISSCFAISVIPFLRKDMGERYFGWLNIFFGYTVIANFMFLGSLLAMALGMVGHSFPLSPQLMMLFWLGFIGASLYHRREIARKNKAGIEWHSMYIGTSLLPVPFSAEKIYKFIEPGLVFTAGYFLYGISGQVGLWLMLSAAGLLVNNHIVYYNERQAILDMRDAQIEARYFSAAISGKPARETAGFVVAESSIKLIGQDARLQKAFGSLSTELKDLIDSPPDFKSEGIA
jgi:hypothetical protein